MRLEIVTVEREVYSDDVDVVVAPGIDGELGILPNHAPLLTALQPGEIRIVKDGQESYIVVSSGFMEVMGNKVRILADTAENADEIDLERAEAAMRSAQERLASSQDELDLERAMSSMARSRARVAVARRRGRRRSDGRQGGQQAQSG
jgi:F-type H+-transporting ATPase subunit epsilon